jgi:membrane-bound lytic murein transglycosylase A
VPAVAGRAHRIAAEAGLRPGPAVSDLAVSPIVAGRALGAFRISCRSVTRRTDTSGLTRPTDWANACAAAARWSDADAPAFFSTFFESVEVGDGAAFATGYYEPSIRGCRTPIPGVCEVPIYGKPADLQKPYLTRAQIEEGGLAGRGLEIAYAGRPDRPVLPADPGLGRLNLPDGSVMRIGYAEQNGRSYVPSAACCATAGSSRATM